MSEQLTYSIRDLEELSGIPAHTIRTWERRYRLFSPARGFCNVRCYTRDDISFLHQLTTLLRQGHRISSLASKSREEITSLANAAAQTSLDSDVTEALCLALQAFDAMQVENLIGCYIRKEGFDKAMSDHFVPFLNQIGFLLLSGVLQPIHVQIFYSTLRQKVHAAIDGIALSRESTRWVLLHDDVMDTIYRDVMHYLLRKAGIQVLVAGQMTSDETQALIKQTHSAGICLVAGGEHATEWVHKTLRIVPVTITSQGKTLVLLPGKTLDFANNSQMQGVFVLTSLQHAFKHLANV